MRISLLYSFCAFCAFLWLTLLCSFAGTAGKRHSLAATNCQAIMVLLSYPAEF